MYRPPQPRMHNNMPRNYFQPNFPWPNPRAFNRKCHSFNPRPTTSYIENGDYWCETCDRGFATVNLLENHKQQHQKCNIDGCQFIAHPKVITKHIQMQHSSGLYKKIAKLDNPEEIKKWREERKRNFPTKLNIEKKTAELNEKTKRGEKMGLNVRQNKNEKILKSGTKRKFENKPQHNFRNKTRPNFSHLKNKLKSSNNPPPKKIPKIIDTLEENRKLKPFSGIQNIVFNEKDEEDIQLSNDNIFIEDDDFIVCDNSFKIKELSNNKEPSMCTALTSLMCNYGSSDEDEIASSVMNKETINHVEPQCEYQQETTPKIIENMTITNEQNIVHKENKKPQNNKLLNSSSMIITKDTNVDEDSGPEEITIIKENKDETNYNDNKADVKHFQRKSKDENKLVHKDNTYRKPKPKLPSTLLQKLLYKEIRHERNIILQCVRYVIKNNYFDENTD